MHSITKAWNGIESLEYDELIMFSSPLSPNAGAMQVLLSQLYYHIDAGLNFFIF